jgi:UDP-N-acetylglucosamine 3-dehydrogenase
MKKINVGLIGLGYAGKFHLRNCLKLESVNLIAVADISKKTLKLAKRMGVKRTFTDYHQLLKQSTLDAVLISLPTHLHMPSAISAAENGKHIFLEKPLARNPEEGNKILSAARKNNVKLMVGYPYRFNPTFCDLKGKIKSGILGDIQTAHAVNNAPGAFLHRGLGTIPQPVPEWWFNKDLTGGGALMDLGSHMINLAHWYFGEVTSIKAYLGYRFNFDFEDHAICIANFTSGTTAIINVGWFSQKAVVGAELFGTVAHASAYHHSPSNLSRAQTAIQLLLGGTPKFFVPYVKEVSHFVNCIKQDAQPSPSGEEALKDLEAISLAYKNQIHLG